MTKERNRLCPEPYESLEACNAYYNRIFNDIRYNLYQYKYGYMIFNDKHDIIKDFTNNIGKIQDPILKHIAIYLIANYKDANIYFSKDGKWKNNPACESLNKWLDNRKSYFTFALRCEGNVHLWNKTIEALWEELVNKSKLGHLENNENKEWCERHNFFRGHLEVPKGLPPPMCYKHVPIDYKCVLPFPPNMCNLENTYKNNSNDIKSYYTKCKNKMNVQDDSVFTSMFSKAITNGNSLFKGIDDITFSRQVEKNVDCPSLKYATPISFTLLGYNLSYKGINKKKLRDNFNEQLEYEEYARCMNKNSYRGRKRNNIYYDSANN